MKRVIGYFWHAFKSSFSHKVGEYQEKVDGKMVSRISYYNTWTNKITIK